MFDQKFQSFLNRCQKSVNDCCLPVTKIVLGIIFSCVVLGGAIFELLFLSESH